MYKIGEFSKLCGLSVKTLRFYANEGLLIPASVDKYTGYRYYSEEQLELCGRVKMLKGMGFTLEEIRCFISSHTTEEAQALAERKKKELEAEICELEEKIDRISDMKL